MVVDPKRFKNIGRSTRYGPFLSSLEYCGENHKFDAKIYKKKAFFALFRHFCKNFERFVKKYVILWKGFRKRSHLDVADALFYFCFEVV